jgi:hypothetical protein
MNLSMLSGLEGKKICKLVPVRCDERLAAAIDELMQLHGRPNLGFGEYIRGLIYIDGLLSGAMPEDADVPHWVRLAYPQLLKREKGGTNHASGDLRESEHHEPRPRPRHADARAQGIHRAPRLAARR